MRNRTVSLLVSSILVLIPASPLRAQSFSNPTPITINDNAPATPYPSSVFVTPPPGSLISDVNVTVLGVSHTSFAEVGLLLVGPGGQTVMLFNNTPFVLQPVVGVNLTFDDDALIFIPDQPTAVPSGSYRPTDLNPGEALPGPAPGPPYGTLLAVYNGSSATGTWSLFVNDDIGGDIGDIAGGWTITFVFSVAAIGPRGRTDNQRSVGFALDALNPTATGDFATVLGLLYALPAEQIPNALDRLHPELYATYDRVLRSQAGAMASNLETYLGRNVSHSDGRHTRDFAASLQGPRDWYSLLTSVREVMDPSVSTPGVHASKDEHPRGVSAAAPESALSIFALGRATFGDIDSEDERTGSDFRTTSGTAGVSFRVARGAQVGIHASYARSDAEFDDTDGDAEIESVSVGPYFSFESGRFLLYGWAAYGFDRYDADRRIVFAGLDRTARSDTDGWHATGSLAAEYMLVDDEWAFGPTARVTYIHNSVDGFDETGADSLNLAVDDFDTDTVTSQLGVRAARRLPTSWGAITPEVRARWVHSFGDDDTHIESAFVSNAGTPFEVESTGLDRDSAHLGAGVVLDIGKKVQTWVEYDAILGSDQTIHDVGVGLGIRF